MPFDLNHAYLMNALANAGGYLAIGLAAIGSAYGAGVAGLAAIGSWKKCYVQNRPAPFLLVALAGMPLSQTIYGMILMMVMRGKIQAAADTCNNKVANLFSSNFFITTKALRLKV